MGVEVGEGEVVVDRQRDHADAAVLAWHGDAIDIGLQHTRRLGQPVGDLAGGDVLALVEKELPSYAQPLFLRLQRQIETTGTFKYRKVDLVEDGFNPARVKDPLYFRNPLKKAWTKVTKASFEKICEGGFKL
eukprot:gene45665-biopygen31561